MEPQKLGKYQIVGKIGHGAMGEVYKAHDPVLNRFVAVKTISAALDADDDIRKRFIREAQSAARLNHPNIITVYDSGEEQGKIYMAMELLEGTDLKEIIVSKAMSAIEEKLTIMEQLCDGLGFAHAKEIVHRDLKPSNIHIQPDGQVKIMDFGLARLATSEMTRTGTVMGTPNYMAPEQVRGEKANSRSDVFSIGAVFYELLANKKAFDADTMHGVLFQVLDGEPEPLASVAPDTPQILVDVVERCLNKDAADRFPDGGQLRSALRLVRKVMDEGRTDEATLESEIEATRADPTMVPVDGATIVTTSRSKTGSGGKSRTPTPSHLRSKGSKSTPAPRSRTPTPAPAPPPPSKAPMIAAGIAAIVIIAVGVGAFVMMRPTPQGPSGPGGPAVTAAPGKPVGLSKFEQSQLRDWNDRAGQSLTDKDYSTARDLAQRVLDIDANNVEAQKTLDTAKNAIERLESAATRARSAFAANDIDGASKALAEAMAINPAHPVVTELSKKLNKYFNGEAQNAKKAMAESRAAASKVNADSMKDFLDAADLGRQADALVKKGEFVDATQKFLQARDGFDRAARAAERQVTTKSTASSSAAVAPPSLAPPPPTAPVATVPPPTTVPVTVPPLNEEPAIRSVIADFSRAIEARSIDAYKKIYPTLPAANEQKLKAAFESKQVKDWKVSMTVSSVNVSGSQATVKLTRQDKINGNATSPVNATITLAKGAGGWTIQSMQ